MSGFDDVRLSLALAFGVRGGPERVVDVVTLASGRESRNARWVGSRRSWDIGGAVMKYETAAELIAFFEARGGKLNGFRFRDPLDWKSCAVSQDVAATDQVLGLGDGVETVFQLVKAYESAQVSFDRAIQKPVAGSVRVALDGVQHEAFSVDVATGLVTFAEAPGSGVEVTAGFEFDVPVRFDADRLETSLEAFDAVRVGRVPIMEIAG